MGDIGKRPAGRILQSVDHFVEGAVSAQDGDHIAGAGMIAKTRSQDGGMSAVPCKKAMVPDVVVCQCFSESAPDRQSGSRAGLGIYDKVIHRLFLLSSVL